MPPDAIAKPAVEAPVGVAEVIGLRGRSIADRIVSSQAFWVTLAVALMVAVMSWRFPNAFGTSENFYNITRNFSFIGIMALGMTAVIIAGGIDLSVGSVVGVVGIVFGLIMQAGYHWALAVVAGLFTGFVFGLFNGLLITVLGLPPFVVTLGTLSIARSAATVLSQNKIIYQFGPYADSFFGLFGGSTLGIDHSMWLLVIMTAGFGFVLCFTQWGRHLFAIGGNEQAARLTGVPVARVKVQAYVFCSVAAAIGAIMILGWIGSANNALGTGYELRVIASTVIGGANLMGGEGGAYGAFIGAALIEVIRNSLLMAGVDSNYQGIFVGAFIILAVLLERVRGRKRE
jgi:ribose transport system permease protein